MALVVSVLPFVFAGDGQDFLPTEVEGLYGCSSAYVVALMDASCVTSCFDGHLTIFANICQALPC